MTIITITTMPPQILQKFDRALLQRPGLGDPEIYLSSINKWIKKARNTYSEKKLIQCELMYEIFMEFYGWTKAIKEAEKMESKKKIAPPDFSNAKLLKYVPKLLETLEWIQAYDP